MSKELHLLPVEGSPCLAQEELLRRLRAEFAYVETSHEKGRDSLEQSIAHWQRVSSRVFEVAGVPKGGGADAKAAHIASLRAALSTACHVSFGDDAEHAYGLTLYPNEGLLIVVEQSWQEKLAERCTRTLGYVAHRI